LRIQDCSEDIEPPPECSTFRISFEHPFPEAFSGFLINFDSDRELVVSSRKGKLKKISLKDILKDVRMENIGCANITLCCKPGKSVRPTEVLKQVFRLSEEDLQRARFRKLKNRTA
jgi:hypothetical protein